MKNFLSVEELWFPNVKNENNLTVNFEGDLHRIGEGVTFFDSCMSFYDGEIDTKFESIDEKHKNVTKLNKKQQAWGKYDFACCLCLIKSRT